MDFNLVLKPVLKGELHGRSRCSRIRMSFELPKVAVWRAFQEMDDEVSGRIAYTQTKISLSALLMIPLTPDKIS